MRKSDKLMHSMRAKMTLVMMSVILGIMVLMWGVYGVFMSHYYERTKKNRILEAYSRIEEIIGEYDDETIDDETMSNEIAFATNPVGVSVYIMDSAWNTVYSSRSEGDSDSEKDRVLESMFRRDNGDVDIIEQSDTYTVQKAYDKRMKDEYLEVIGSFSDGKTILLRLPIRNMEDNVDIFNRFITYVGLTALVISFVFVAFFSALITKPVKELEKVANRMSQMDFSARYTGNDKGELGMLGNTMNQLSEKLEENISQLKTANLELQKDIENKIEIEERRRDFLSNVSHELKTPIALIEGYAEGLKEGIADNTDDVEYYCDVISDEARRMDEMVKKLLTLDQMEWADDSVVERFNVTELARSVLQTNELRFRQKDIRVVFDCGGDIYAWGDEYKIEEVLTNYVSNAINHCDNERIIKVNLRQCDGMVRVEVFNTGSIIPEEDLPHIWEKFYKVDKARTREYGGNGIGLSIVKAIMESGNNRYGVVNHSNGVEFWFELQNA
jgi:signal transduction histidine kinase